MKPYELAPGKTADMGHQVVDDESTTASGPAAGGNSKNAGAGNQGRKVSAMEKKA